jgi:UDP-glucose:(heptosyl)LPS alpha-1,3-glucosyltransferase
MRPNCVLVVPAQQTLDQLQAVYRNLPPTVTIHPGVTLPCNPLARNVALASLGLDATAIYCLLVANDPLRKGMCTILSAMETLDDRFRLIVLGGDEACHVRLRAHIPAALAGRVHTYPARTDVGLFYACGDLYLHPTLQDSFGMAPLEAMSYGMPVIISAKEYCGFSACVQAGSDALVVTNPHDAGELALAIHRISHDPVFRATLCANGLALASRFDWRAVEQKFVKTYTEVLAG